jgi:hypothetical protein
MRDADILRLAEALRSLEAAAREADDLERRLIAAGVDPRTAARAANKALRTGCPLCLAKTRKGTPCVALGDGRGNRCKFHGGMSTGPRTEACKARALAALRRYPLVKA